MTLCPRPRTKPLILVFAALAASSQATAQFREVDAAWFGAPNLVGADPFAFDEPAVIGFDLLPDGSAIDTPNTVTGSLFASDPLSSAFAPVGVLLGSDDAALSQPSNPSGIGTRSLPNVLGAEASASLTGPIEIEFTPAVRAAGIWIADGPTNDVSVTFRDASGGTITTLTPLPDETVVFLGIASEVPIGFVELASASTDDWYAEDLHFLGEFVCPPTPTPGCLTAAKASLSIAEKKAGSEKLKATLKGFDMQTVQQDFGDPVGGATRYDVCIYDDMDQLVAGLTVDRAGDLCGPKQKPCWKAKKDTGCTYKDPVAASDGVKKVAAASGAAGKGKLQVQAGNKAKKGQLAMPTGVTVLLQGAASARVQVATSDAACFEAVLGDVKKADGVQFKAKTAKGP